MKTHHRCNNCKA